MIIQEVITMPAVRITPQEAYEKVQAGQAILVCGYEEEEKFRALRLEGAISFAGFQAMLPSLPKDREIIFYCA
jgi:rhodanese-related sulfurtransferase